MTIVFQNSKNSIGDLIEVLNQIADSGNYEMPFEALSNATIGQHTRHIIELYQCLLAGYAGGEVNYDDRTRNVILETNVGAAVEALEKIKESLIMPDKQLKIVCGTGSNSVGVESNYFREVLYNLEHCIHHQALIRVGLVSLKNINIAEGFGVAPSTLQYRKQCVQ